MAVKDFSFGSLESKKFAVEKKKNAFSPVSKLACLVQYMCTNGKYFDYHFSVACIY